MKRLICIVLVVAVLLAGGILAYVSFTRDRILTEADFAFLERGMSLEEVVAVVGEPCGATGPTNSPPPHYELDNGRLTLIFNEQFGPPGRWISEDLAYAIIAYSDGGERRIDFETRMTRVLNIDAAYREINRPLTPDERNALEAIYRDSWNAHLPGCTGRGFGCEHMNWPTNF